MTDSSRRARTHRVRDVAEQAGLSEATVDRVLNARVGVSDRARRAVEQALLELDRQQDQLRLAARTLLVEVVVQAPSRFSDAVREALEAELRSARPAAVRARFHLRESADAAAAVETLDGLGLRARLPRAVLLKAPDDPAVAAAARRVAARGIPVVTLVTDIRDSGRAAYVGLDNAAAGSTAAYLLDRFLGDAPGDVVVSLSRSSFFGERERAEAFTRTLAELAPRRRAHVLAESDGLDASTHRLVAATLVEQPGISAVYSAGGGNRAIAQAFADAGRTCRAFVAHDLDDDNRELLRTGAVTVVLHHDLRRDMRQALRQVLRAHRMLPGAPTSVAADVQVVTPHNVPPRLVSH